MYLLNFQANLLMFWKPWNGYLSYHAYLSGRFFSYLRISCTNTLVIAQTNRQISAHCSLDKFGRTTRFISDSGEHVARIKGTKTEWTFTGFATTVRGRRESKLRYREEKTVQKFANRKEEIERDLLQLIFMGDT